MLIKVFALMFVYAYIHAFGIDAFALTFVYANMNAFTLTFDIEFDIDASSLEAPTRRTSFTTEFGFLFHYLLFNAPHFPRSQKYMPLLKLQTQAVFNHIQMNNEEDLCVVESLRVKHALDIKRFEEEKSLDDPEDIHLSLQRIGERFNIDNNYINNISHILYLRLKSLGENIVSSYESLGCKEEAEELRRKYTTLMAKIHI